MMKILIQTKPAYDFLCTRAAWHSKRNTPFSLSSHKPESSFSEGKKKNATSPVTASTNALCSMLLMLTDSSCWRQDGELIAKLKASENSALMTYSAFASLLFYCGNSCASVDFNSCGGNIMSVKQMHCFIKQNKFNSCLLGEGNMDPHCALVEQKRCIVEPLWESRKWRNQ